MDISNDESSGGNHIHVFVSVVLRLSTPVSSKSIYEYGTLVLSLNDEKFGGV